MSVDHPLLLFLAPVAALAAGLIAWRSRSLRLRYAAAWSEDAARLARSYGRAAPVVIGLAVLGGMIALANPRGGRADVTATTRALSVVFAMDISRSMLAEDVEPNRLERAVREARRLAQDLEGDRMGLIAFAGRSYILAPLTVDVGAINLFLDGLDPDLASQGGTSLGSMLAQARGLLSASQEGADRVLIVFTDGETHDSLDVVRQEAEALRESGIRLVLVAEGDTEPVRIPIRDSAGTLLEYKLDDQGRPVETARRDEVLQAIAGAGDGTIVAAGLPDQAGAVEDLLDSFKRSPTVSTQLSNQVPRGWIPVLVAAVLLLAYTVTRRHAALIVLAGCCLLPDRGHAQSSAGARALERGRTAEAASRFLKDVRTGGDTAWYNGGTAAMLAGRLDVARRALAEASRSPDPALRYRALYNLGVAALLAARSGSTEERDALLAEAERAFRDALLLQPSSERAKWNLELTLRQKPPSSGGGGGPPPPTPGGGGGGGAQDPDQGGEQESPSSLSRREAEQILNSVDREERATRARQAARSQGGGGNAVKDW